jgi:hypothetical protein
MKSIEINRGATLVPDTFVKFMVKQDIIRCIRMAALQRATAHGFNAFYQTQYFQSGLFKPLQ